VPSHTPGWLLLGMRRLGQTSQAACCLVAACRSTSREAEQECWNLAHRNSLHSFEDESAGAAHSPPPVMLQRWTSACFPFNYLPLTRLSCHLLQAAGTCPRVHLALLVLLLVVLPPLPLLLLPPHPSWGALGPS